MQANELRIGNWVKLPEDVEGDRYAQIGRDDFEYVRGLCNIEQMSPIPLTPEILEKAGFKKEFYGWTKSWVELSFEYHFMVNIGEYHITDPLQSLHQLQNLYFALTGTELVINL
jgi:hypothetical protein